MTVVAFTTRILLPADTRPAPAERFFAAAFGRAATGQPGGRGFELPHCVIEVVGADVLAAVSPGRTAPLLLIETADLDAALAEVERHGGQVQRRAFASVWGLTAVALDPSGNPFVLVEPASIAGNDSDSPRKERS